MTHTLQAEARTARGKQLQALRAQGSLPAVVYGAKEEATPFVLSRNAFEKVLKDAGESTVIVLSGLGGDKEVLIHDVAYDPVTGTAIHADFYAIEKGKAVTVDVPITFVGQSPAVKQGAVLTKVLYALEVEAMPKDLPHEITIDVSTLVEIDDQIAVGDLPVLTGVTFTNDAEDVIVVASAVEEEVEEPVAPVDMSAIEVEAKGKKEEEGESEA